jgi:hypothetical protein
MTDIIHNPSHYPPSIPSCFLSFTLAIVVGIFVLTLSCAIYGCSVVFARDASRFHRRENPKRTSVRYADEENEPAGTDATLTRYMSLGPESMATAREGSLDTEPGYVEIAKVRA